MRGVFVPQGWIALGREVWAWPASAVLLRLLDWVSLELTVPGTHRRIGLVKGGAPITLAHIASAIGAEAPLSPSAVSRALATLEEAALIIRHNGGRMGLRIAFLDSPRRFTSTRGPTGRQQVLAAARAVRIMNKFPELRDLCDGGLSQNQGGGANVTIARGATFSDPSLHVAQDSWPTEVAPGDTNERGALRVVQQSGSVLSPSPYGDSITRPGGRSSEAGEATQGEARVDGSPGENNGRGRVKPSLHSLASVARLRQSLEVHGVQLRDITLELALLAETLDIEWGGDFHQTNLWCGHVSNSSWDRVRHATGYVCNLLRSALREQASWSETSREGLRVAAAAAAERLSGLCGRHVPPLDVDALARQESAVAGVGES